ncbi:tetratricopeptide repeat protein [Gilvibacter sediminis]|uniref:tetratricopeptide repeat protein n=1 Tax=Gilvibacter sediminis TaxID=379071 RepID=UPI00235005CD|nr:tetratricopeptide repeat protein [Gilvibacter sediminis]MDC7996561.1 tetratricopeptide repeat protein [Gilvibacter sediminis]
MRSLILILLFLLPLNSIGQSDALAQTYFEEGKYDKALRIYQSIYDKNPRRLDIFKALVATHQQLENYQEAGVLLENRAQTVGRYPQLSVDIGYNYELQDRTEEAKVFYQLAIDELNQQPNYARFIGDTFDSYGLLEWAVKAYERGMELNPNADFFLQLSRIYGELQNFEKMFEAYLGLMESKPGYSSYTKRSLTQFITEDPANEANVIFRKTLIKRIQQDPDLLYNELLSWLYVQQKEFRKSFSQEKAIYKRKGETLEHISQLASITVEEGEYAIALEIFEYIIDNSSILEEQLDAEERRLDVIAKTESDLKKVEAEFDQVFEKYGLSTRTYALQIAYNDFIAFKKKQPDTAILNLKVLTDTDLNRFEKARVKMKLADILVYTQKFNQALIFYSQIQKKVQGNILAQEARFKVARTSYFKGDFKWSQIQLDVLKKSTSQLIANDAMELSLLISDNSVEDTTQTALRKFAKADLLSLQNKPNEAVSLLTEILETHKGESIEDEALLRRAKLYTQLGVFEKAEVDYKTIIELYKEDILADDAYFNLAQLYEKQLALPERAQEFYEQIVFNFPDSIYFVDARKRYRSLRGDTIN